RRKRAGVDTLGERDLCIRQVEAGEIRAFHLRGGGRGDDGRRRDERGADCEGESVRSFLGHSSVSPELPTAPSASSGRRIACRRWYRAARRSTTVPAEPGPSRSRGLRYTRIDNNDAAGNTVRC